MFSLESGWSKAYARYPLDEISVASLGTENALSWA